MSQLQNKVPLGAVLQQAGLVSAELVKEALAEQKQIDRGIRIGDILASKGYIDPKTADFFAEHWLTAIAQEEKQPVGQYLKQAALLNEQQIQTILAEQQETKLKFGEIAVAKGWVQQTTINFFLRYLSPNALFETKTIKEILKANPLAGSSLEKENSLISDSSKGGTVDLSGYSHKAHHGFLKIKLKLLNIEDRDNVSEQVLRRVLWWSGGQSFLAQKIFKLISRSENHQASAQKPETVDILVKKYLLEIEQDRDLANHFRNIRKRLLNNQNYEPINLLRLYQRVLNEKVPIEESTEQRYLLKTGLVVRQKDKLTVANPIYRSVFDRSWIGKELNNLQSANVSVSNLKSDRKLPHQTTESGVIVGQNLGAVPPSSSQTATSSQKLEKSSKLKNSLLFLALIALLSLFFSSMVKRVAVRTSFSKGNELLRKKSFEQAVEEYNNLLNTDSNYFQAWTNRGYALAGLKQYEQMRESCSTATIIEPTAVYAWNCLGEALHNLQREDEAIAAFDRAITLDRSDPIFLINKSESLKALGNTQESLATTKRAIQALEKIEAVEGKEYIRGEFAVALTFLGNSYRKEKEFAVAVDSYNRALDYLPNYFPAHIGKGIVLNKMQRYPEAQEEFRKILENTQLSPTKQAQAWFYLGQSLCATKQNVASIAAFEEAIKLKPEYTAAKEALTRCS